MKPIVLIAAAFAMLFAARAAAEERINSFDILIDVKTNGDIVVTETIDVTAEGNQIRRGIYRDLPRFYESNGARLSYSYNVLSVTRDGESEPYETMREGGAFRIRIGDADVFLDPADYAYEIRYRVKNQVRYFETYDEVYWNATGTYWDFPIDSAVATIALPPGGVIVQQAAYTGPFGAAGRDYKYAANGDRHIFMATKPLPARAGLTVALGFEKGLIDPPSATDRITAWWRRNVSLVVLTATLFGLLFYYWRSFNRVGRDPVKTPVFPRYEPPKGYSPAATHYILNRRSRGHTAFIATIMNFATRNLARIEPQRKKITHITPQTDAAGLSGLAEEERSLHAMLFRGGSTLEIGKDYDAGVTMAYQSFESGLARRFGAAYFRWNTLYIIFALVVSAVAFFVAVSNVVLWTGWHTLAVLGLAALNILFMYLMPAPTPRGQEVRTEIEGFKLYMETAEKLQLNAVEVGAEAPPPMTVERYERFLPYAIALGVERPWTKHFEKLLPTESREYRPRWTSADRGRHSLGALNRSLVSGISSGVTSSLPQSSSSSGSGGGGSSGGGGGGGGGGGW